MKRYIVLFMLCACVVFADPTNLSLQGIIDWTKAGGNIGSGSGTLPTASETGSLYVDNSTPTSPLLYRSDGSAWRAIAGSGSGTSNHSELNELDFASSGHTGFAAETGSTTINFAVATPTEDYHASTKKYVDDIVISASGTLYHSELNELDFASSGHTGFAADTGSTTINFSVATPTEDYHATTKKYVDDAVSTASGTNNHSELDGLDFASSGHTGFASEAAIPNNASFTLSGLSEKDFSSLENTPTTIAGYGLTDAASTTALADHIVDTSTHGCDEIASASAVSEVQTNIDNHIASSTDPHGASMTLSVSMTIGSGTEDCTIERYDSGIVQIASYIRIVPEIATPTEATGILWYDGNVNVLKCYDGSVWKSLWE